MKNRNKSTTFIDISYTRNRVFFILSTFKRMIVETKKSPALGGTVYSIFTKILFSIAKDFARN